MTGSRFPRNGPMRRRFNLWMLASLFLLFAAVEGRRLAAQQQPADAAAQPAAQPGDVATPEHRSLLQVLWDGLGWWYFPPFLLISICLVALTIMNAMMTRHDTLIPGELVDSFETHLKEKRYTEAYELVRKDESFLGHVLSAGLGKLSAGYATSVEAMQEVGEEETMKLEQRLGYLALIGTISPMVGLLGTVHGMVQAFGVIREAGDVTPKPSQLAAGIELALITTLVGLVLAIPAILAYHILRNIVTRRVLEVGRVGENLMARFSTVGRAKPAAAAGTTPAAALDRS